MVLSRTLTIQVDSKDQSDRPLLFVHEQGSASCTTGSVRPLAFDPTGHASGEAPSSHI